MFAEVFCRRIIIHKFKKKIKNLVSIVVLNILSGGNVKERSGTEIFVI